MVNMGENVIKDNIKEIREMKKEIVEPNLGINKELNPHDLLINFFIFHEKKETPKPLRFSVEF